MFIYNLYVGKMNMVYLYSIMSPVVSLFILQFVFSASPPYPAIELTCAASPHLLRGTNDSD